MTTLADLAEGRTFLTVDEDLEWQWSLAAAAEVVTLYQQDLPLTEIAERVDRPVDEVFDLLRYLMRQDCIQERPSGWRGRRTA